ncbi:MAG: succinate dehydrogenase, cytochrome b556 subunit [Candidatus Marinimicrobia bacterium]|nr:succinate dehydrogenase, cytochrome b556 subunit [Candidatus Neomarinimicrobiota bacterium]
MKKANTLTHYRMNFQLGMFSYIMHRITGITLLILGVFYLIILTTIQFGPISFDKMMMILDLLIFRIIGTVFVVALLWHVLNGLKILIIDLFNIGRIQKLLTAIVIVMFLTGATFYLIHVISLWVQT